MTEPKQVRMSLRAQAFWLVVGWVIFIVMVQQLGCQLYPVAPQSDSGVVDAGYFEDSGSPDDSGYSEAGIGFDAGIPSGRLDSGIDVQDSGGDSDNPRVDHDNGHGNDEGCVDDSNPGNSKGCKEN